MSRAKPTEAQVLAVLAKRRGGVMTYVIRNGLQMDGVGNFETRDVLTVCRRLERAGKVKLVHTNYAVMLCWDMVE
ncbi:hypothetical protein [Phenylobacterium ferrooxidans]|uniref:Uncharacterized protein n=1 Tax=Phenylobacterium ferrooxidans TaxID=2982689 RepID=A0ABW6CJC6_9CAUL